MNHALLYLGGLVILALSALFAVPYFVDWNSYRGVFEEEVTRVLGRDVRVGGNVNLRLLPSPYVRFEKLKIADVGGEAGESVFRAESFTMWLSIPPLLQGVVEARKIEIKKPVLRLVTDGNGGGNWQSLSVNQNALKFVPKGVALQSVSLVDGTISFGTAKDGEIARVEGIAGELAAEALAGPYRFAGNVLWQGQPRDVRVSTAAQDADGAVRFKTSVRVPGSGNSYLLAGHIADLMGKPKVEGDLSAFVHLDLSPAQDLADGAAEKAAAPAAPPPSPTNLEVTADIPDRPVVPAATEGAPPFEMHAKLSGDVTGLSLDDINLSLEQEGAPQIISGSAKLGWTGKPHVGLALTSRWLDLDRLSKGKDGAAAAKAPPLSTARAFFEGLAGNLPIEADADAALALDQVTLGGEAIGAVKLKLVRAGGPFQIKELRANLPGGTRIESEGVLDGAPLSRSFDGQLSLRGANLTRFLTWALEGPAWVQGRTDGAFAIDSRIKLAGNAIEISDADAELAGQPLSGEVRLTLDAPRALSLSIEGHRIDAGSLWPNSLETSNLTRLLGMAAPAAAPSQDANNAKEPKNAPSGPGDGSQLAAASPFGPDIADVSLKLRAAEMVDGDRSLKDVDADVALVDGALTVRRLHLKTASGLVVDLHGGTATRTETSTGAATSTMKGMIEAPTGAALATLAAAAGFGAESDPDLGRWSVLAPVKIAGSFTTGGRISTSADLTFDGLAAGGRVMGRTLFDGGWRGWRSQPANITLSLESAAAWRAVDEIFGTANRAGSNKTASGPALRDLAGTGRLLVKAVGTAEKGLLSVASIERNGRTADFDGRVVLAPGAAAEITGEVALRNAEARAVLPLAGIEPGNAVTASLSGAAGLTVRGGKIEIKPRGLVADGARIDGNIAVTQSSDPAAPRSITADLDVDSATVPGLLALLLERPALEPAALQPPAPVPAAKGTAADKRSRLAQARAPEVALPQPALPPVWPEQSFEPEIFRGVSGSANVRFGTLALEPGFAMQDAMLKATFSPGKLKVESLEAQAMGGRVTAGLALDKAAAGASLAGTLGIDIPDAAAFTLGFNGQALGPAALISSLSGKGELQIGDATLNGNTPKAVAAVSEAALQGKGANSGDELANALKAALKDGALPLGKLKLPVTLSSGNLMLDNFEIETPDGTSSLKAVVELQTLRIDSEWQIAPRVMRAVPVAPADAPSANAAAAPAAPPGTSGAGTADAAAPPAERVQLPALSVSYTGKLRDFSALEPIIATAALERELSVRKMERDVDELERLHRQDQARAKADLERQRLQEEERAKALAAQYTAPLPLPGQPDEDLPDGTPGDTEGAPALGPDGEVIDPAASQQPSSPSPRPASSSPRPAAQPKKKPSLDVWKPFQLQPF